MELKRLKEKRKIYLIIVSLVVFALLVLGFFIFRVKIAEKPPAEKEKTLEEILQSLTAPEGELPQVPEEVIEDLTALEKLPDVSEEIIQGLTAPENK